ncbi:hypothetical protein PP761_gp05 [Stenotrophomonas phage Paxi]|uniref:Uncharacterized protein n=1 Tax=Stenotrophomonas phage Paxi TaxID=2859653 RepID=A0AAE7WLN8_9CAUD|nr:hypothetical protein PP761_gp05 [Stenotrophomonas phage Paxi]QYW01776.1 hypothetical protein CPT_Paxi_005 [Stenotrophomonas phage Paxi]
MSNRIDRSLGVKPYSNHGGKQAAPQPKGLKLKTVLICLAIIMVGAALYPTSHCQQEVRCVD